MTDDLGRQVDQSIACGLCKVPAITDQNPFWILRALTTPFGDEMKPWLEHVLTHTGDKISLGNLAGIENTNIAVTRVNPDKAFYGFVNPIIWHATKDRRDRLSSTHAGIFW